jgi:hypothetical protein
MSYISKEVAELEESLPECKLIKITENSWSPFYISGDLIFISPSDELRVRNHVALRTKKGRYILGVYAGHSKGKISMQSFDGINRIETFDDKDIASICKIAAVVHS